MRNLANFAHHLKRFSTARENNWVLRGRSTRMSACTNQNINLLRDGQNNKNITSSRLKCNADSNNVIAVDQIQ